MARIDDVLRKALESRASDIHFSANEPIRMRVDGDLAALEPSPRTSEDLENMLFEILNDAEREKIHSQKNVDKSHIIEGVGYFRVNIFWTRRGIAAVLRTIPKKIPTMEELKLPPACTTLSESPKGLVLVTGPTGSGKSTTLAAMINHINSNLPYHILTAEDPVEFVHESKKSLINQREIGASCHTFADALKYALREDPDVILVGEMRDLETIGLALTAAETGHLVFGTLHTRGAGASVDRIIDSFPANQQAMIRTMLSESLVGVISQSLLKRCDKPGRVAAFEIMIVNHAISNLIREGKTFQIPSIIQTGRKDGMILMDQHILELVDNMIVTAEEAEAYMEDASPLQARNGGKSAIAGAGAATPPKKPSSPPLASSPAKPVVAPKPVTPPPIGAKPLTPPPIAATPSAKPLTPPPIAAPVGTKPATPPPIAAVATPAPAPTPVAAVPQSSEVLTDLTSTGESSIDSLAAAPLGEDPFIHAPIDDDAPIEVSDSGPIAELSLSELEGQTGTSDIALDSPIGEDPFASTSVDENDEAGLDLSSEEIIDLPNTGEFSETRAIERDDTATHATKVPAAAARPVPAPPVKAAPPPPAKPTPAPAPAAALKSSPPPPTRPIPAAPPAPAAAAPKAAPTPIPGRTPFPPPPAQASKRPLPPPPPPGAKKAG